MRVIVITGMSGAGKTNAMNFFEDRGYFCVDNIPPVLMSKLLEVLGKTEEDTNVAFAVDMRLGDMIDQLPSEIKRLTQAGHKCQLLYIDADDATLIKRYTDTKRAHPLSGGRSLIDSITEERKELSGLYKSANYVIDTSNLNIGQMHKKLKGMFEKKANYEDFCVNINAFGFKYGIPLDADLVFDVRCLPNPYYIEELREKTGNDKEVRDYVMSFPASLGFFERLCNLVEFMIPEYMGEGRLSLNIAIGCSGGRHRSVTMVNKLNERLKSLGYKTNIILRELK